MVQNLEKNSFKRCHKAHQIDRRNVLNAKMYAVGVKSATSNTHPACTCPGRGRAAASPSRVDAKLRRQVAASSSSRLDTTVRQTRMALRPTEPCSGRSLVLLSCSVSFVVNGKRRSYGSCVCSKRVE